MIISIDIGGTNTRIALFNKMAEIISLEKFKTPQDYQKAKDEMFQKIDSMVDIKKITGISIGLPAIIEKDSFHLISAPHLPGWTGQPVSHDFSLKYQVPVVLANDTDLGGLAESIQGAGNDSDIIAYLAIGTGIGGVRIVHRKIDENTQGFEPGHMIISKEEQKDRLFKHFGSLESYVSGTALREKYGITKTSEYHNKVVWNEIAKNLAIGLVNISLLWSPHKIVLGGGVILHAREKIINPTQKHLQEILEVFNPPKIEIAQLGDEANLIGAYYNIINF